MVPKARKYAIERIAVRTFVRAKSFHWRIEVLLASCGQGIFSLPQRCKILKTIRFPAPLRLAGEKICSCHYDPVYEFMT
jgi:hypothetical protein